MSGGSFEAWDAVSAIAAVVSAVGSIAIAWLVYAFTKQSSQMQAMRDLNSQWQAWNMAILANPELANFIHERKKRFDGDCMSAGDERMFASLFYQLNILYDLMLAQEAGLAENEFTTALRADAQNYVFSEEEMLDKILDGKWGYPERFLAQVRDALSQRDREIDEA
jgi:hypothetical protein